MSEVVVKGCAIGAGIPKICVPIVAKTMSDIFSQARAMNNKAFDVVEWRADWFEDVVEPDAVCRASRVLRGILGDTPLLFTFRTAKEGGEQDISTEDYIALNRLITSKHLADLIDVELFAGEDAVRQIVADAHQTDIPVIISNHDFDKTPPQDELISRLRRADALGGDILKIAAMPQNSRDVLELLCATEQMSRESDRPLITMSMGRLGVVSRLSGEIFGSAMTFGTVGFASAPGQVGIDQLRSVLELLHNS